MSCTEFVCTVPAPLSPDSGIVGSLVIAGFFNWGLTGVLILQSYIYFLAFPQDRLFAKILVYSVLVLELIQTAATSFKIFSALEYKYGTLPNIEKMDVYWLVIPVFGGLTGGIGQYFFAYRIWTMTKKREKGAPVIIGVLAAASVISALVSAFTAFLHPNIGNFNDLISSNGNLAPIGVWNGFGALCDITIALTMPYYLMRHGTGLRSTHVTVVNLIRLIIETGVFTAAVAILHFCLYFAKTPILLVPGLTISKVYANTVLVLLNNRMKIVNGRIPEDDDGADHLEDLRDAVRSQDSNNSSGGRRQSRSVFAGDGGRGAMSGAKITVKKDRLVFRLSDHGGSSMRQPSSLTALSEDDLEIGERPRPSSEKPASPASPDKLLFPNDHDHRYEDHRHDRSPSDLSDVPLSEFPGNTRTRL